MTNKSLAQWLEFISNTHTSEIEMGLDRIKSVYSSLSLEPLHAKIVLVAGTNGKGSTVAMIESGLLALGYKVGAYTSPHILSYNERVRINGLNVEDSALIQAFEHVEYVRGDTPLTYFEYGTLAAFDILFSVDLDVIVLEIGLGGRLDAVNIVDPDISIISSIGIDHSDWLGNTLEEIGAEKAGILRQGSLFIGGENLPSTILETSKSLSCRVLLCRNDFDIVLNDGIDTSISLKIDSEEQIFNGFPTISLPENNILISMQAITNIYSLLSGQNLDQQKYASIVKAFNLLKLPGRLEKIELKNGQEVYIDVGHNPHAAEFLKSFLLKKTLEGKKIQIVYSSLADKDVSGIMDILSPLVDRCILAPLKTDRAMTLDYLIDYADKSKMRNVLSFPTVEKAIEDALYYSLESAKRNKPILTLIFGSFYIVEAAKRFFETYD